MTFPEVRIPIGYYIDYDDPLSGIYNTTNQTILDQLPYGKYLYNVHLIVDVAYFGFFTVDFLIRFIACPRKRQFAVHILNIFDFFSIFLFWIFFVIHYKIENESLFFARRIFESLRFLTMFRVFKLHWKFRTIPKTFVDSSFELIVGFITIILCVVTMSTTIFYCEVNSEPLWWFDSIPATFWWTIVTITTVIISFIILKKTLKFLSHIFLHSRLDMETFIPQVLLVK